MRAWRSTTLGWTISDGVSGETVVVPGAGSFNSVAPKDAISWGLRLGFFVDPKMEVGFRFNRQFSALEVGGTTEVVGGATKVDLGDAAVRNYHAYFAYNFGEPDAKVRPYVLAGLGATQYGKVEAQLGNQQRDIGGASRFSSTWGGGLKFHSSEKVGFRLEGRWTPHLHQGGRGRLVVRCLLGLLRGVERAVFESARSGWWRVRPLLVRRTAWPAA